MKIEAGCKAVIINSYAGNDGLIVNVIKHLGKVKYYSSEYGDRWEIDATINDTDGIKHNHICVGQLKRIDDDARKVTSWDALKDIYVPPSTVGA